MISNFEIDNIDIDFIYARLKKTVSHLDILRWLENFEPKDVNYAIDIASNLTVYTTYEIESILDDSFKSLFTDNDRLIVGPVGKFGKSGCMITYFFQKTDFYNKNKNKILLSQLENIDVKKDLDKNLNYKLVLLDDFIGSGKSIKEYLCNGNVKNILNYFTKELHLIAIAGMKHGIDGLKDDVKFIKIPESNIFNKVFYKQSSLFGYRKYIGHREFAYKYGKILRKKKDERLGFDNSQSLVSFEYGTPNNTLPIIWANTNVANTNKNWKPLIPRFFSDKVNVSKELRKTISYELSILKEFGNQTIRDSLFTLKIKKGKNLFFSVSKIDFSIYSIIKLSSLGFKSNNICQKLGILTKDYDEILQQGKERGIFDDNNKLTDFGLELFKDAKKCISNQKKSFEYESNKCFTIPDIDYLPKIFNGKS